MTRQEQEPIDGEIRRLAVQPTGNWVLRAPAGSGKTTLLVTRFLELLSRVEKPEEILAITFTRKATAEMRERILASLRDPDSARPDALVEAAKRAKQRSLAKAWEIVANPSRLKIQTIESFRRSLVEASPVEAGIAPGTQLVEDAREMYGEAVDRVLRRVKRGDRQAHCMTKFLHWEGNNHSRARRQLIDMLGKRDQWSGKLYGSERTQDTEFRQWLREPMNSLWALIEERIHAKALAQLVCAEAPGCEASFLQTPSTWRRLAELLLTKDGSLRRRAPRALEPDRKALWERLVDPSRPLDVALLQSARHLPDLAPPQQEQARLDTIKACLGLVGDELRALFDERGTIDLVELGFGATASLGDEDLPTDLIIALDYSIKHILVDEFQDTSVTQSDFLHSLVREWMPGDDRSFFAVGDPMQSIYGFREAEVGLFSLSEERGVGRFIDTYKRAIELRAASLKTNFRSQTQLVEWANHVFPDAFGGRSDLATGAVPFESAVAFAAADRNAPDLAVEPHLFQAEDGPSAGDHGETQFVASHADALLQSHPEDSVAILLRNRTYASELLSALRDKKLTHQGHELDRLQDEPVVQDLLVLAKCIASPTDRLANFALVRGPAAGLSLASMHRLAQAAQTGASLADLMLGETFSKTLPDDEGRALERLAPLVSQFRAEYGKTPPRSLIERAWIQTGLAGSHSDERARRSGEALLALIEEQGLAWIDFHKLDTALEDLYAPAASDARLRLMTIHQAKGLEFDHVILPFAAKGTRQDDALPIRWHQSEEGLLVATRHGSEQEGSAYKWLERQHKTRVRNEAIRILYVAVTRAKKSLCLTATLAHKAMQREAGDTRLAPGAKPRADALISPIWDAVASGARLHPCQASRDKAKKRRRPANTLHRLPDEFSWQPKKRLSRIAVASPLTLPEERLTGILSGEAGLMNNRETWTLDVPSILGTVVHEGLRWLSMQPSETGMKSRMARLRPLLRRWLMREWLEGAVLKSALREAEKHLLRALGDKDCEWILRPRDSAASEQDYAAFIDNRLLNIRVDRTFVEHETRFIIDYKTAQPRSNESQAQFRERQVREHRPQLETYARVFKALEDRPVEAALFLTSTPELVRVAMDGA